MITNSDLKNALCLKELTESDNNNKLIADGCVCDLLSWVMAKGTENMAWVTVQTHLNVVAVACLHDFACVIIPENIEVPDTTIEKANEEGVTIFSSPESSYQVCKKIASLGVGD